MRTLEMDKLGETARPRGVNMPPARPQILAGSEANLVAVSLLAKAFEDHRPEVSVDAPRGMGSAATVRAVAEGLIAVGLISRPLRDAEGDWGLTVLPYARTAVIWGAHPSVQEEGISAEELLQIHLGAKTNWRDGREIVLFTREPQDSTIESVEQSIPGLREILRNGHGARNWTTLYSDQGMNRLLAATPGALGPTDLGSVKASGCPVKALLFNGIPPTAANVESKRYPLVKTLSFVFRRGTLPVQAMAFIQFARSKEAEKVLRLNGFLAQE